MPKPEKLYTFADLREVVPLSESTLRQVLAELGMGCGKGRRLLFDGHDFARVIEAVKCSSSSSRGSAASPYYYAYGRVKGIAKPIARSLQTSDRREARRRLRELVAALEAEALGPGGGAAAAAEPDVLTFADAIDSYIEARSPGGYTPGYLDRLRADRIGDKPLAEVIPGDILKAAHRLHPGCADATKDRNVIVRRRRSCTSPTTSSSAPTGSRCRSSTDRRRATADPRRA